MINISPSLRRTLFLLIAFLFINTIQAQTLQEELKRGDEFYYSGQYKPAIEVYEKARANKNYPHDSLYAALLNTLGWTYVDDYSYKKAESIFIEEKELKENLVGKSHPDYAYTISCLSLVYYYQGLYSKAEPLAIEAKNIRERDPGKNSLAYANSCFNLGNLYYDQRQYNKAEPLYIEAKTIYEKTNGKEDNDYIKVYNKLADLYYDQAMYNRSLPFYIEVKELRAKIVGVQDPLYARACHNLASVYLEKGDYNQAEQLFAEAKNILAKNPGTDQPEYALACNGLSNVYFQQSLYAKAISLYSEAKKIYEQKYGKTSSEYAMACNNIAGVYKAQGLYSKAEELYMEAKNIQEKLYGKEHPEYAFACNNLGSIYGAQGLYDKAEVQFTEAKKIYEKKYGTNHPQYAMALGNLATLYLDQGMYVRADQYYVEAKNTKEKIYGKNHPGYAAACNSLANLYTDQGLYSKSEPLYLEAKMIYETNVGKNNPKYATACNNLANLYFNQKFYEKAEPLYVEAKSIQEKILGKDHPSYAMSCNNLGSVYYAQGQYAKAETYYLEAKSIQEKNTGKDSPAYAMFCGNLASVYRRQGQYVKAEIFYIEEKNIREKVFGKDHPLYANSCNNLGNLYAAQNNFAKAGPLYKEAVNNKLRQIDEMLPVLSEKERDEFYKSIDYYFKRYYYYVLHTPQPALYGDLFNLQLQIKGLIFQSTQKMQRQILNSGNTALIANYEEWKKQRVVLNRFMQMPIAERTKKNINTDSIQTIINELEKSLSIESQYFALTQKGKRATWRDVQKKLQPNEAAVEIIRTDSAYIALVITPLTKENPEAVIFRNGAEMDKRLITYYRTCIAHKIDDEHSYNSFWLPIKEKIGNATKVYVCADGVYHQLNLLTLKNTAANTFLFNETSIQLVSNFKDLLLVQKTELEQQYEKYKIHLIAYPQYDGGAANKKETVNLLEPLKKDTSQRFYDRGGKIQMLAGTKTEAGNIAALCTQLNIKPEVKLLEEASESYIKSLHNPGILHIATHGFFLSYEEAAANSRALNGDDLVEYVHDPLLNSGLLLANAQQGISGLLTNGEDGVLTAKEALNLTLDKTDLVVMSACETGLGEIRNGEGVYGLQRAFQQAGAKTVIISLWKVSDEATQELMSGFYENLLSKKLSKREAFQQAQAALMKKYPSPYYWGAFVVVGE